MKPFSPQLALVVLALAAICALAQTPPVDNAPPMITVFEATLRNGFSIRHDHSQMLGPITRLFFSSAPDSGYTDVPTAEIVKIESEQVPAPPSPKMAATMASSGGDVRQIVSDAGNRNLIDPDFISSVIRAESGFNPRAVSPKGAQGLMQLMPQTSAQLGVQNAFEPSQNIDGGARYLRQLLELYHGDAVKALAAYNAGPERVAQYNGVPPYHETHAYVAKVIRDYNRAKLAQNPNLRAAAGKSSHSRPQKKDAAKDSTKTAGGAPRATAAP